MYWIQKIARLTSKYYPQNLTTAHIFKGSHKSLQIEKKEEKNTDFKIKEKFMAEE
jgi:hypothetical protein